MELQLLVILAVAFLVFGPEKMLEFATQLGRLLRRVKQEWAAFQLELEMEKLKEELKKTTSEGEQKVKNYLSSDTTPAPKTGKDFLDQMVQQEEKKEQEPKGELTMEELFSGKAPVIEEETTPPEKENKNPKTDKA